MIFTFVTCCIAYLIGYAVGCWPWGSSSDTMVDNLDNRVKVIAISENLSEIQKFLNEKVSYLTDDAINLLIARIEELRADRIINEDDISLKQRISDEVMRAAPVKTVPIYIPIDGYTRVDQIKEKKKKDNLSPIQRYYRDYAAQFEIEEDKKEITRKY